MRVAAFGFIVGTSMSLTASLASLPTSLIIQGGALAILGWAVWYMLAKAFPAHFKAAREERAAFLAIQKKEREEFLRAQEDTRRDFRDSLTNLASSLDSLTASLCRPQKG